MDVYQRRRYWGGGEGHSPPPHENIGGATYHFAPPPHKLEKFIRCYNATIGCTIIAKYKKKKPLNLTQKTVLNTHNSQFRRALRGQA